MTLIFLKNVVVLFEWINSTVFIILPKTVLIWQRNTFWPFWPLWPLKASKGQKRLKFFFPNNLELSNLARNQIKKFSPAKFFSTFVTLVLDGRRLWWPFFEKNLVFEVQESLY